MLGYARRRPFVWRLAGVRNRGAAAGVVALSVMLSVTGRTQDDAVGKPAGIPAILKIGGQAPDFNLPGIDGQTHSLKDYASSRVLVIVFTCDHCPVAQMYEKRIKQLTVDYRDRGVALVAINPNDPRAVHLSEMGHTDLGDSLAEMKLRAEYRSFNFPYLSDGATQAVARAYGPTATPHVFIFDEQRNLQYEGRIDNNPREALATKHEAKDAIEVLLAGHSVVVKSTPAVGCSTKWVYKEAGAKAEIEESQKQPVKVEMASADEIKVLRANTGTGKLLLVNFWATWCEPCLTEFPELQKMVRMYRKRNLDIVTVSINSPDEKKFVVKFLEELHAINRNLLFNGSDPADAVSAFGTGWSGGVPYTVLIGANGDVLFKTQGGMNSLEVRRAILKNLPDDRYIGQHDYWNSTF
ncbi:MAG TPA: redoxin domain-containing protein [Candidatus Dormibacteraeota bacterium]|nr:redoxin domain-containing protein [Candidatus Dormibacteraeota bacterium]